MKKFLALFLGLSFLLFNLSFVSLAKTDDPVTDEVTLSTSEKATNKVVKSANGKKLIVIEKKEKKDPRAYYGFKKVVNHPFKICWRGLWWGFVGGLIPLPYTGYIGFVCGAISKALELYEHGYEKAPIQ